MRAIRVSEFGGPEVLRLEDVPDAPPGPGEATVEVDVAGVLSVETVVRSGHGGEHFPVRPPYVPGSGAAGQVGAVGEGVGHEWIGTWVLADIEGGGYAERVTTAIENLIPIPDGIGVREAMALLHDGAGALWVLERAGVKPGETVLVQPGAGGLGSSLVQLAHAAGARVIAAARGDRKLDAVSGLGAADLVVDYGVSGWTDRVGGVDVAFDGVGGDLGRAAYELVAPGGRYSNYGWAGGGFIEIDREEAARRGVTAIGMEQLVEGRPHRRSYVRRVLGEAAAGRIRPLIGEAFPLERAADAHAALENRNTIGKVLLLT